jgi:asparaginyl-tRNA synthetase
MEVRQKVYRQSYSKDGTMKYYEGQSQLFLMRKRVKKLNLRRLTNGAAVRLTGQLVSSPGSGQSHELLVDEKSGGQVEVVSECDPEVR